MDDGQLPVLPGAQAQDEVHDVGLFFAPEFLQVFVGSHFVVILNIIFLWDIGEGFNILLLVIMGH